MNMMTISMAQFPISYLNRDENASTAKKYCAEASARNTELLLFPEMSLTGISFNIEEMGDYDQRNLAFFTEEARKYSMAIGFGWGNPSGNKLENHYTIVGPDGNVLSDYIKIHPFTYGGEDKCFSSGDHFTVFSYKNFRICTLICYDMRFPELFQAASKEADLICIAANWPKSRNLHWKILSQARAIENQVYLAACNCVSTINNLYYSGDSTLYNPNGDIIKRLSDQPGLVTATIENNVADVRSGFPVKNDRKTDFYKTIL